MIRRALIVLLTLVALVVASLATFIWTPLVEPAARTLLRELLPGIRFAHVSVHGWLRIELDDVRALDADGLTCARVAHAELDIDPLALRHRRALFRRALLRGSEFHVRWTGHDHLCILDVLPQKPPAPPPPPPQEEPHQPIPVVFDVRSLQLDGAQVVVHSRGSLDAPVVVIDVDALRAHDAVFSDPLAAADFDALDAVVKVGKLSIRAAIAGRAELLVPYAIGSAQLEITAMLLGYTISGRIDGWIEKATYLADLPLHIDGVGDVELSALVTVDPKLVLQAALRAPHLDLRRIGLDGYAALIAQLDSVGPPLGRGSHSHVAADLRGSVVREQTLDEARFEVRTRDRSWQIERAAVRSGDIRVSAEGHGSMRAAHVGADVTFAGRLPVVDLDASFGRVVMHAQADMERGTRRVQAHGFARDTHLPSADITDTRFDVTSTLRDGPASASARVQARGLRVPSMPRASADVAISVDRDGEEVEAHVVADVSRKSGLSETNVGARADATARVRGERTLVPDVSGLVHTVRGEASLVASRLVLEPQAPEVDARATVAIDGALQADANLQLKGQEVASATARLPRFLLADVAAFDWQQPVEASVEAHAMPLSAIAALLGKHAVIDGTLDADASITGSLDSPRAQASASVTTKVTPHQGGPALELHGELQGLKSGAPTFEASAVLGQLDLSVVKLVLPELNMSGALVGQVTAHGALSAPIVAGEVSVENARASYLNLPPLEDIQLHATLDTHNVIIDKLTARGAGNNGSLSLTASLDLDHGVPRRARARLFTDKLSFNAPLLKNARVTLAAASNIAFGRSSESPSTTFISGGVVIERASIDAAGIGSSERRLADIGDVPDVSFVMFDELGRLPPEAASRQLERAPIEVDVLLQASNVSLRNEKNQIDLQSQVRLKGRGAIAPVGTVDVTQGRVELFSRLYEVEHARVSFGGGTELNPTLDVRVARDFPAARVIVEVHGTASKPDLALSSQPAIYDRSQLLALVLTGREEAVATAPSGQQQNPLATTEAVATSVATALLGPLASKLGKKVGIDVVRIGVDRPQSGPVAQAQRQGLLGDSRASLELGRYFSDRIYVGARGVLGATDYENSYEARLEYLLTTRLRLESVFGDKGVGGLDVLWRYAY